MESPWTAITVWLMFFSLTNSVAAAWHMLSSWHYGAHHMDHGCWECDSNLGIRSHSAWQPCFRRVSWCDRGYLYTCNQGNCSLFHSFVSLKLILWLRFRHLDNVLNTFTAPSSVVASLKVLRYLYIVIFDGEQRSQCSIRPTNSVRYELIYSVRYTSNYYI